MDHNEENQSQWLKLSLSIQVSSSSSSSLSSSSSSSSSPSPSPSQQHAPMPHHSLPLIQYSPIAHLSCPPMILPLPLPFPSPQETRQEGIFLAPSHDPLPRGHDQNQGPDNSVVGSDFGSTRNNNASSSRGRPRGLQSRAMKMKEGKSETIAPPFPWATSKRAMVYSMDHLLANGMRKISGTVKCKYCEKQYDIEFDLKEKFDEVVGFIVEKQFTLHDRAPEEWACPLFPSCKLCGQENCLKPVITKKRNTNWLFLFLGQMIGYCKLAHLKYFCKHTLSHRTGAKNRLLYLTYMGLCRQLQPDGPFGK
ncbi:hypothetical protein RJT34_18976 [Clitoria ternatea]|uniref:DUF7086 domain-containing protein n=1 Tax=Clitoria ternatea TaxID=43366 RepID=A0AAN9IQD3_CLITE